MNRKLISKKAIITGGNKGIGKAIATAFAKEGCDVLITYNADEELANHTVEELSEFGGKAHALHLNCADKNSIVNFLQQAISLLSNVNILVNNAGIVKRIPFLDDSNTYIEEMFAVNFFGPFMLTKEISNHMVDCEIKGSIINISSISDTVATKGLTCYQSTKAALSMLSKGIALELAEYGIRVNTVSPGLVQTDINRSQWEGNSTQWEKRISEIPLGRSGLPIDIAPLVVFLASDESSFITGSTMVADGGRSII